MNPTEDAQRELDAYRAYEMAESGGVDLQTIFNTTGGFRQGVVDAFNKNKPRNVKGKRNKPKSR